MNPTMSTDVQSCYIHTDEDSRPSIYLPNNVPVIVGRNVKTQIVDLKCSRNQVRLCAKYSEKRVTIQQIGTRASGFNGAKTLKGEKYLAKHGDTLEIIYGKYNYKIEFNPPPPQVTNLSENKSSKKRSCIDSESDNEDSKDDVPLKKSKIEEIDKSELQSNYTMATVSNIDDQADICEAGASTAKMFTMRNIDHTSDGTWQEIDNQTLMIFTSKDVESREKIASFDMDGTLITTQSGLVFPKDHNDWKLLFSDIPDKLKQLHNGGYKIVIFTNQRGLGLGKSKHSDFKQKIEKIVKKLSVPVQVFIATSRDSHRKPLIGMWESLVNHNNDQISVDKSRSFYVGDAAGRPKDWTPKAKKDHSSVDRLFAMNLCLTFKTPEEHFLGHKPAKFNLPTFNPKNLNEDQEVFDPPNAISGRKKQEVVIMVGSPASGKTHVVVNHLKDYRHINRDKLGSWQKCVAEMEKALSDGKNVVIDNTNPNIPSRKRFIDVARARSIPVRCFVMTTSIEHAKHNNRFRELTDPDHTVIADVTMNTYAKNYVPAKIDEGFTEIVKVNFVPHFNSDYARKLYEMYLLEK